jgi:hypothetical protein
MTTELRQLMREMTEGYRFKERMSSSDKCSECGGQEFSEMGLCVRCDSLRWRIYFNVKDRTDDLIREAINSRQPFVRLEQ